MPYLLRRPCQGLAASTGNTKILSAGEDVAAVAVEVTALWVVRAYWVHLTHLLAPQT